MRQFIVNTLLKPVHFINLHMMTWHYIEMSKHVIRLTELLLLKLLIKKCKWSRMYETGEELIS